MVIWSYRVLLLLLPGWFREEFRDEMTVVFRDSWRHASAAERIGLACVTAADVAALAFRLHVDALKQDVGYAIRTLARTPAFTLAAVATLALGLGPTLVVANFVHQVVVAPLPFAEADRLVRVWNTRSDRGQTHVPLSVPDAVDLRNGQSVFEAFAAHAGTSVAMVIDGMPRQLAGVATTSDLHQVLRVQPAIGRGLMPSDSEPGAPPVIVLGPALWRTEFAGRADVIGQTITVDGRPTTIVGVLPDVFDFPAGTSNYWVPFSLDMANGGRGTHFLQSTARLAAGYSMAQAQEALTVIGRGLAAAYPDTNKGKLPEVYDLKSEFNGDAPRLLGVLGGAIGAVLLIACLNVASLLTVRTSVRGGELAVRTALGATGRRLRRQLIVEHAVLTAIGGVVAAVLGFMLHRAIVEERLLRLPRTAATFGWPALVLLAVLVVIIGVLFAWLSTRRSAALPVAAALMGSIRQTSGRSLMRLRQLLIGAEVAATLVLLVIAGLMLQSAARLARVDPGFRTNGILTFGVALPSQDYARPADRTRFAERVREELRSLPGVRQAAFGAYAPMGEMRANRRYARADAPPPQGQEPVALDLPVGPGYFEVMGIALVEGRSFSERDTADAPPVIIVSEQLARAAFPDGGAIGRHLRFFSGRPGGTPPPAREIVGIVRDVRQDAVAQPPITQMYTPYAQTSWPFVSFFVLTDGDPGALSASIQRVVARVDPMRPARDVLTIDTILRGSTQRQRAMTWMLLVLAALAVLIATVGLYGVSATAAAARSRELAIRAAVGANPRRLTRLVVRQGLLAATAGIMIGAPTSLAATRGLESMLYEVPPRDPATLAGTALLLLLIAAVAAYLPARRALARNPAEVLRAD